MIFRLMKRVLGATWREVKNFTFEERAIKKAARIASGEKVAPPRHPTEEKALKRALSEHDELNEA